MAEETNNEILEEEKAPKEVVIPEFYRDLSQDPQMKALWHYVFRTNGDRKPIKTPDGKPHKLDFTWKDMFPNENGHIEVEIGSGKGNFMTDYAEKHPDYFIMGSEWDFTWAAFAHERMEKRGIVAQGNAAMLRGDVFYFLRDAVKDNTVDAFHMYFPDPWPKWTHSTCTSRTRGQRNATTRTACCAQTSLMKSPVALNQASAFSTGAPTTRNTMRLPSKRSTPIRLARCLSAIRQNRPKAS